MDKQYFIATTREQFINHVRENKLNICHCVYINDHLQVAGLKDITITVLGHGKISLERQILQKFSHHGIKLRNI